MGMNIVVSLMAATGSFVTDTGRAEKSLRDLKKEARSTAAAFKASFAGNLLSDLAQQVGRTLARLPGEIVDSIDAFNDLKDATGASIEKISALDDVARRTGVDFATVETSLIKFNQALNSAKPDSDAANALKALGLNAEELKKIDPAEALRLTAVALSGFADNGNKARIVQELFGKSLKEVAPFLKDLAEKGELVAKTTEKEAEEAEKFNKMLFEMQANSTDAARALMTKLLPALISLSAEFKAMIGGTKTSATLGTEIRNIESEVEKLEKLKGKGFTIAGFFGSEESRDKEIAKLKATAAKAKAVLATIVPFEEGFQGSDKPSLPPTLPKKAKEAKATAQSEAERYLETLEKQIEKTEDLSHEEQALKEIQAGRLKGLTPQLEKEILKKAQLLDLEIQRKELRDGEVATNTNIGKAQAAELDGILKMNAALREEVDAIGLSKEELAAKELQLVRVTLAEKESTLAKREAAGVDETQLQVLQAEIEALKEKEDLLAQRADKTAEDEGKKFADKTGEATRDTLGDSIEQGILDGFRKGSSLTDIFLNELKAQFAKTILRPIIQPLADAGNQAINQILGLIGKSFTGPTNYGGINGGAILPNELRGGRASGGPVSAGQAYMVGENGPEPFIPNTAGRILPNSALGGNRTNIVIENHGAKIEKRDDGQGNIKLIIEAAVAEVDRRIASGTGSTASAMKSRGISLDGALPRRA